MVYWISVLDFFFNDSYWWIIEFLSWSFFYFLLYSNYWWPLGFLFSIFLDFFLNNNYWWPIGFLSSTATTVPTHLSNLIYNPHTRLLPNQFMSPQTGKNFFLFLQFWEMEILLDSFLCQQTSQILLQIKHSYHIRWWDSAPQQFAICH